MRLDASRSVRFFKKVAGKLASYVRHHKKLGDKEEIEDIFEDAEK